MNKSLALQEYRSYLFSTNCKKSATGSCPGVNVKKRFCFDADDETK
jgi:hypothetical protein